MIWQNGDTLNASYLNASESSAFGVDNVAVLSTLSSAFGSRNVETRGVNTPGDGGGGTWYYDGADSATPVNVGTVVASADGKRWKRVYGGAINVKWFGARGDNATDDTAALQRALDIGGIIDVPNGVYNCNMLDIKANTYLRFQSRAAEFAQLAGAAANTYLLGCNFISGGTADVSQNRRNIRLEGGTFRGRIVQDGFLEFVHLVNLNAVSGVRADDCAFIGFRGDGLYLGSGVNGLELHNEDIVVEGCLFDGVNKNNRNGISIIDGTQVSIKNNYFMRCTRSNMPGAIDLEPDAAVFHRIRQITIEDNFFTDNTEAGAIVLALNATGAPTTPYEHITIRNNKILGSNYGVQVLQVTTPVGATNSTRPLHLEIENNTIQNCNHSVYLHGARGVGVRKNKFVDGNRGIRVSPDESMCRDITLEGNTYERIGLVDGIGLAVKMVTDLNIRGETLIDCGLANGTYGIAISFGDGVTASGTRVNLEDTLIRNALNRTQVAVQATGGYSFVDCSERNTRLGGLTQNDFRGRGSRLTAPPATGAWLVGDTVLNSAPTELGVASSKYVITGWTCITAGTPGTWMQNRTLTGN